jgi:phospholipid/cholesterol/gamma-HCH transport system permease protein
MKREPRASGLSGGRRSGTQSNEHLYSYAPGGVVRAGTGARSWRSNAPPDFLSELIENLGATAAEAPPDPPPAGPAEPTGRPQRGAGKDRVEEMGGLVLLTIAVFRSWFTPPITWWRESVDQAWIALRRCLLPGVISVFAFAYGAPGIEGGVISSTLGATDRIGLFFSVGAAREFVPWVTGMVVAGVAGTAITADLGARRTRDELDALAVMGVDITRFLVAPRVLALMLVMPIANIFGLVFAAIAGVLAELTYAGTTAAYLENFQVGFTTIDLLANVVKTVGFGFIIGIVCSFKGIRASGGPEGVGRAVNQAVVVAFVALWVFNFAFNATYQALYPVTTGLR